MGWDGWDRIEGGRMREDRIGLGGLGLGGDGIEG